MLYFSSPEAYLAVYGWAFFNLIYNMLIVTGIWLFPPLVKILSIVKDVKSSQNTRPAVDVAFHRLYIYVLSFLFIMTFFMYPALTITADTIGYHQRSTLLNPTETEDVLTLDEDTSNYRPTFGDVSLEILSGSNIRVPIGWYMMNNIFASGAQAAIDVMPELPDIAAARSLVLQAGGLEQSLVPDITDNNLLAMASLLDECEAGAMQRLDEIKNLPNLSGAQQAVIDGIQFGAIQIYSTTGLCLFDNGCGMTDSNGNPRYLRPVSIDVREQGMVPASVMNANNQSIDCSRLVPTVRDEMLRQINEDEPIGMKVIEALELQGETVYTPTGFPVDDDYIVDLALRRLSQIAASGVIDTSAASNISVNQKTDSYLTQVAQSALGTVTGLGSAFGRAIFDVTTAGVSNVKLSIQQAGQYAFNETMKPALSIIKGVLYMMFQMFIPIVLFLSAYTFPALGALIGFFFVLIMIEPVWAFAHMVENGFLKTAFDGNFDRFVSGTDGPRINVDSLGKIGKTTIDNVAELIGQTLYIYLPGVMMVLVSLGGFTTGLKAQQAAGEVTQKNSTVQSSTSQVGSTGTQIAGAPVNAAAGAAKGAGSKIASRT